MDQVASTGQLLAEGKDLKHEVGAVAEGGDEHAEKQQRDLEHGRMRIDGGGGNVNDRREYDLWRGTGYFSRPNARSTGLHMPLDGGCDHAETLSPTLRSDSAAP